MGERRRMHETIEVEKRRAYSEQRQLERQLHSLQVKSCKDEQRAVELLRSQESLRLRWQLELGREKEALEVQVERLSKENRVIRERSRGVLKASALAVRRAVGEELLGEAS